TVLSSVYFGERDQILGIALFPFVMIQLGLTFSWPRPRPAVFWSVVIFGAVLILLKPHFGLLPTILLLHRAILQRRLALWKDPDFIALVTATSCYILFLLVFFSDYLTIILPDVLRLYLPESEGNAPLRASFFI